MAVYFAQHPHNELIKIGKSYSVLERMKAISMTEGAALKLLGVIEGGLDKEKELHSMFDDVRVSGEWFAPSINLIAFIEVYAIPVGCLTEEKPEDNTIIKEAFSRFGIDWKPAPTIREIARSVGVTPPTVYNALQNPQSAKISTLRGIFKAMGYKLVIKLEKAGQ